MFSPGRRERSEQGLGRVKQILRPERPTFMSLNTCVDLTGLTILHVIDPGLRGLGYTYLCLSGIIKAYVRVQGQHLGRRI